jgi:hypothetical protein
LKSQSVAVVAFGAGKPPAINVTWITKSMGTLVCGGVGRKQSNGLILVS